MKLTGKLICSVLFVICFCSQKISAQTSQSTYDKKLADSLGADEYGMKKYVLVILKSGTNEALNKSQTDSLFRGHMDNINRMVILHKLVVAGPLMKNENKYRGIFILNVTTIEEAHTLLDGDPAIKQKLLDAELFTWYGSAALPTYLPFHDKIEMKQH